MFKLSDLHKFIAKKAGVPSLRTQTHTHVSDKGEQSVWLTDVLHFQNKSTSSVQLRMNNLTSLLCPSEYNFESVSQLRICTCLCRALCSPACVSVERAPICR